MTELALLKMAHLLCLVYWLGLDLGVYYSSFIVADEKQSPKVRVTVAKILFALDLGPRICMTLMLPTGIHIAYMMGRLKVPDFVVTASWAICLAWLAMVLVLHFVSKRRDLTILTKIDFYFRIAMVASLLTFAVYVLVFSDKTLTDWLVYKTIIFACLVFLGLMIRVKLRVFAPAMKKLIDGTHSAKESRNIGRSLASTKPYVYAIWIGLLINTAFSLRVF